MSGHVSKALEEEVRTFAQRNGLVIWLDAEGAFCEFADQLALRHAEGTFNVPVVCFRESFLELALALESQAAEVDMAPLIVHMPGFNKTSVRETPLLELYRAGKCYERALEGVVKTTAAGLVPPATLEKFIGQERDKITLEAADRWLEQEAVAVAGGVGAHLQQRTLPMVLDDLMDRTGVAEHLPPDGDWTQLWDHLGRKSGLDETWRESVRVPRIKPLENAAQTLAGWSLCVEYVHDLKRKPREPALLPLRELAKPLVEACREVCQHMRTYRPRDYERFADEYEARFREELRGGKPEELGSIDTFREEEVRIYRAALTALADDRWDDAAGWAADHREDRSFWVRNDPHRHRKGAWRLVEAASDLGQALAGARRVLEGVRSLEEAVDRYAADGWPVDQLHRVLEQRRTELLDPRLPRFGDLRAALDHLRRRYRRWADDLCRDFSRVCEEQGFLAGEGLQQRFIFEEVVRPLCREEGPVVLFLVDAFRYEMAEALRSELRGEPGTRVDLRPRLSELPTTTPVGMNALSPVADGGRLRPVVRKGQIRGFATGEFQVCDWSSRQKAMHNRVGGDTCPRLSLDDVLARDATSLRRALSRSRLLIVHSLSVDDMGEGGVGLATFDLTLRQLRHAWSMLRGAGGRRFVFTADHGFLLLDDSAGKPIPLGRKVDHAHRFAHYPEPLQQADLVCASMAALRYVFDGKKSGGHLVFPRTTRLLDRGKHRPTFIHGGNSPQERVIPVLQVLHRGESGGGSLEFAVVATARSDIADMHRLCVQVGLAQGQSAPLAFGGPREIELALRVPGRPEISVELCDVEGKARLLGNSIHAEPTGEATLYFRLRGPDEDRVKVELFHPTASIDVKPGVADRLFAVQQRAEQQRDEAPQAASRPVDDSWEQDLSDEGARRVFVHLARHGAVTEGEATAMLGGARKFRRFVLHFEEHCARVPFRVGVEYVDSSKRYVRLTGEKDDES